MRKILILLACLGTASCQTAEQAGDARAQKLEAETLSYYRCGMSAARSLAQSANDPYSIAVAAQSICAAERLDLHRAIERTYSPSTWSRLKTSFDQSFLEGAIARVVKDRAGS